MIDIESVLLSQCLDSFRGAKLSTRKNFIPNKFCKPYVFLVELNALFTQIRERRRDDCMQHHYAVGGQEFSASVEKRVMPAVSEVFKRANTYNPVDRLVKLFPSLKTKMDGI